MRNTLSLVLVLGVLVACGEKTEPTPPADDAPKGKLRVEYYEISKK